MGRIFLILKCFRNSLRSLEGGSDNKLILIFSKHDFSSAYLVVHVASIIQKWIDIKSTKPDLQFDVSLIPILYLQIPFIGSNIIATQMKLTVYEDGRGIDYKLIRHVLGL